MDGDDEGMGYKFKTTNDSAIADRTWRQVSSVSISIKFVKMYRILEKHSKHTNHVRVNYSFLVFPLCAEISLTLTLFNNVTKTQINEMTFR